MARWTTLVPGVTCERANGASPAAGCRSAAKAVPDSSRAAAMAERVVLMRIMIFPEVKRLNKALVETAATVQA